MSFTAELSQAVNISKDYTDRVWQRSVAQAFNEVVTKTPVDTGIAQRSWLIGKNNSGAVGNSRLNVQAIDVPEAGGTFLLYSNLVYVPLLEDGRSDQAPNGMVKTTVANWVNIVARNKE